MGSELSSEERVPSSGPGRRAAVGRERRPPAAWRPGVLAVLLITCGLSAEAQSTSVSAKLSNLVAKTSRKTQVGLVVADGQTGEVLFAHGADTPLKPASVQKLFVTAAALERFGPGFEFQTRVYAQGDELLVIGGGDPGLGDERIAKRHGREIDQVFDEWAAAIRQHGLRAVGRVVLDDSVFDDEYRHPDWPDDQEGRWYQAPVGGLNLNDNCLDVSVVVRGGKIETRLQPELPPGYIKTSLTRGKKQRVVLRRPADSDVFQLNGSVTGNVTLDPASVRNPTLFFALALKRALEKRGIEVRGDMVRRAVSESELAAATLLATHTTALRDVLWRCNTFSQNLFAECLIKALPAYDPDGQRNGTAGSWPRGSAVVRATLAPLGLDLEGVVLRDGSGLSHANAATAGQLVQLLVQMRRHRHAAAFAESLAEPGEQGSMRNRYADAALRGRLRGKTGTIAGVHALAGYFKAAGGRELAFAILVNGPGDSVLPVQVCKVLAEGDGR